jgi:TRAP-type mannitol/chloroaromatic compound transport system substrate-binding protein
MEVLKMLARWIDHTPEWVGPLHDLRMGFCQAAKHCYYPGWHEPGTYLEYFFTKKACYNNILPRYTSIGHIPTGRKQIRILV